MGFQILTDEKDLQKFNKLCEKYLKISYPKDCYDRSKVRALTDDNGEIVGGYILTMSGSFRVVESLPDHIRQANKHVAEEMLENGMEITGLWLAPHVKSKRMNFRFWTQMYLDIIFSGKKHLYYAYGLEKTRLAQLYSIMKPTVIYQGETKVMPGMQYVEEESVEIASVKYIRWALFHRGDFLAKKLFLSRSASSRYFHALLPGLAKANIFKRLSFLPDDK